LGAEKILLEYKVNEIAANKFVWDIELHTGKYHQIRAQLAFAGCPVIGDILYGSTYPYKPDSIALHAYKLIFHHPITDKEIVIEAV